jgi:hypothetical protein
MNNRANYIGAIRGPILLITLGTILAIDHSGSFSFSRTWPVLVIVIGLMKLLERSLAARPDDPPPSSPVRYGNDSSSDIMDRGTEGGRL